MVEKQKLRVGVVGCGFIGQLHAQAIRNSPHATLCAVCDIDLIRAASVGDPANAAAYTSVVEMFDSVEFDVVTVATPDHLHVEPVMSALEKGIHVFCEKPLASSSAEAQAMMITASKNGVYLGVDYNRRFGFGYQQAKKLLATTPPSTIRQAVIQVSDGIPLSIAKQPYGILKSLVSHHLDLLRWFGGDIRTVQATMRGPAVDTPHDVSILTEAFGGMIGIISASWRSDQKRTVEHFQLTSDEHVLSVQDVQDEVCVWQKSFDNLQRFRPSPFESGHRFYDTILKHVLDFLAAIAQGSAPPVSTADGYATLRLIEAAIESQDNGKRIELPRDEEDMAV